MYGMPCGYNTALPQSAHSILIIYHGLTILMWNKILRSIMLGYGTYVCCKLAMLFKLQQYTM